MSQQTRTALQIALIVLTTAIAAFYILELGSSDELLDKIALVQPGVNINSIKSHLGYQMYEISDINEMMHLGSIKNPSFYQGKKMYWFGVGNSPARALEVYTDKNDIIVYATWQQL